MSVHWPIIRTCLARPSAPIITDDRRTWRSAEVLVGAMHVADVIAAKSTTQTLGLLLPTSGATAVAALAGWMLGRTIVPLNYLLKPDELQYVIDDCGTDTILTAEPLLEHIRSTGGRDPRVKNLIRLETLSYKGVPDPRWPSLRGIGDSADELALLLYTSGTSGKPKGVMLSHRNLATNVRQCVDWVNFTRHDTLLGVLPQFHSFGMTVLTLLPLTVGCKVVYSARFVPNNIVRLLRQHRPTALIAIPSMYNALLSVKDATPEDFSSLKYVVSGGEPLSEPVAREFRDRFDVTINEGYGLTETSPVTNWCRPHEFRPRSVGKPLPNVIERIVDPATGADLPPGHDGEVWIAGPNIMHGYLHLAEETARALTPDGFLRTGDMGRFDHDGHLYITGRIKEMIIVGGENVFPREIEEALDAHPAVQASGVVGYRDELRGETPVAFIELKEGFAQPSESELRSWCRERLAGYKVPSDIRVVEALPKGPTGKVLRRELHAIANHKP
ncbi:MAG: class I adenylate-forming enzyme family protein [Phycisphaerales bacterium]